MKKAHLPKLPKPLKLLIKGQFRGTRSKNRYTFRPTQQFVFQYRDDDTKERFQKWLLARAEKIRRTRSNKDIMRMTVTLTPYPKSKNLNPVRYFRTRKDKSKYVVMQNRMTYPTIGVSTPYFMRRSKKDALFITSRLIDDIYNLTYDYDETGVLTQTTDETVNWWLEEHPLVVLSVTMETSTF